ncbi:MAG: hypothetical protein IPK75_18020 [Acidobacteria bacterium]|nr:hypothetical protein [Acidobacteriota bacterium]
MSTSEATKIVIVAGQEFSVPAATDNEAIRQQLLAMGFTDVAGATVQKGARDGTETVEFVKRAGTKGLRGADLARQLAAAPRSPRTPWSSTANGALLDRLMREQMTIGEALATEEAIRAGLEEAADGHRRPSEGAALCARVDRVPAIASTILLDW